MEKNTALRFTLVKITMIKIKIFCKVQNGVKPTTNPIVNPPAINPGDSPARKTLMNLLMNFSQNINSSSYLFLICVKINIQKTNRISQRF